MTAALEGGEWSAAHPGRTLLLGIIIIIINILTAIGLAPGGSSPVHIYREHYIEYTNNTQNT